MAIATVALVTRSRIAKLSVAFLAVAAISVFLFTDGDDREQSRRGPSPYDELKQIETALEQFKSKYGSYPPDHQSPLALSMFLKKSFPRATELGVHAFQEALQKDSDNPKVISPSEALVLYLTFMARDPRDPYQFATKMASEPLHAPNPSWKQAYKNSATALDVFYEFSSSCLEDRDGDGFPEFIQRAARGAPLVYFDARSYTQLEFRSTSNFTPVSQKTTYGAALPYAAAYDQSKKSYTFYNPKSYQLICAGLDGQFGVMLRSPSPVAFPVIHPGATANPPRDARFDSDNFANFTSGHTFATFAAP